MKLKFIASNNAIEELSDFYIFQVIFHIDQS
jgi:hypothetical protein